MSSLPASIKRTRSKTTEKRWRHRFPHYKSMGAFCCHGNTEFWSNLPQNLMQPFPHPSDATYKIWTRLANWLQRFKFESVDDGRWRRAADHWYTIAHHVSLRLRWASELKTTGICKLGKNITFVSIIQSYVLIKILYLLFLIPWHRILPTTPVVPSPISSSCDCDNWTISLAIWCSTSICFKIVAPSFVIVTSPSGDTMSLSRPLGPRDVLRTPATVLAAIIWDCKGRENELHQQPLYETVREEKMSCITGNGTYAKKYLRFWKHLQNWLELGSTF